MATSRQEFAGTRVKLQSGLEISRVGLGTAAFGGLYSRVSEEDCEITFTKAFEAGITFLDTAPHYGKGVSESRIGKILKKFNREEFQISSKVGRLLKPIDYEPDDFFLDADTRKTRVFDYSAKGIDRSIKDSLERLQIDNLDIVFIHDPEGNEEVALKEAAPALSKLREAGYIRSYGVGMNVCDIPTRFVNETDVDIVLIAGRYSLLDQIAADSLLPAAEKRKVDVVVAGVFNSGLLAKPEPGAKYNYETASTVFLSKAQELQSLSEEFGISLVSAALQFPFSHPAVKGILVGCRNGEEVVSNTQAMAELIPEEFWVRAGLAKG